MAEIYPAARNRSSPYYEATVAEGVTSFTVYNGMLMPTGYGHPEDEYWRLINGVAQWDVACERQVQLTGPDAGRLAQVLSTRNLSTATPGQGRYVALCNHAGTLINDPVVLKRDEDCYWFSIADSNVLFWARAIAAERSFNVAIVEPDVSPMAVQGPKAENVVAGVFGDWVRELKYFGFRDSEVEGIPVVVQRSGYSKQGGFELYLRDSNKGVALWNIVREAGRAWDIGPGNPNLSERTESGLVSWGADTDDSTNPFEVRMGRYVHLDLPDDVVGLKALRRISEEGPKRHQLGIVLEGDKSLEPRHVWSEVYRDGEFAGYMTNCVWSPRLQSYIGYGLVGIACQPGDEVTVSRRDGAHSSGRLTDLPFV